MSTVSLVVHTSAPSWTRAVCEASRDAVDEIVVAVDSRVSEDELGQLEDLVDRLYRYEYADPPERVIAWLSGRCSGDWLLRLDHDEVPSRGLLRQLPGLIADEALTHYWLLRRWPYPTADTYLDEPPWEPDRVLRLVRNDSRFIRFPGVLHVPVAAEGPGAWIDAAVYHFDLLVNDEETRRRKAERWERLRPGMRTMGRTINEAVYLPEHRPGRALGAVPDDDAAVLRSIGDTERGGPRPLRRAVPLAGRAEIDAAWPARPFAESAYRASIRLATPVEPIAAGERKLLEARVRNEGDEAWPWGGESVPAIRLSYHWLGSSGEPVEFNGVRTPLPHDLEPGAELLMPLTIQAPAEAGDYVLQPELVHEHRRWFGDCERVPVRVARPRRIALLARRDASDRVVELAFARPEHEVVLLPAYEYLAGDRGSRHGTLLRIVGRAVRLIWSAGRGRSDPEAASILAWCEELLVEGPPRDRVDRAVELVTKVAARAAGCKIGR